MIHHSDTQLGAARVGKLQGATWDLLVIGGGINGAGIARDAAGRGVSVLLVEQDDLANHTSSASTKLIHGGLRYLEYGELRLVRESLIERERLWGIAPHIIRPLEFVLPQINSPRPAWMVRTALFLYDHLGGRKRLPATRTVRLGEAAGLKADKAKAFIYSDCWVDDSRLVVLNAMDAAERGATILTRTRFVEAQRHRDHWVATVEYAGNSRQITARAIVNAAGPWVGEVLRNVGGSKPNSSVRLIKGSHIILPRLYEGEHAFLLQNPDRRVVFAIPYEDKFTLVGTTDEPWEEPPGHAKINAQETDYLLATVNRFFSKPVGQADIVWSYSGIRPLYEDHAANAAAVTRDYVLDLDASEGNAPLLSIFGGKITTYRKLAEHALNMLAPTIHCSRSSWTAGTALPGGDMANADFESYVDTLRSSYPKLPQPLLLRLAGAYGTRVARLLRDAHDMENLGEDFGGGLTACEIDYLVEHEWACTAEDILFRRSKLGLHVSAGADVAITGYLAKARFALGCCGATDILTQERVDQLSV